MAEWTGLEPATPGVTGRYSNQLNYHSMRLWRRLRAAQVPQSTCQNLASPSGNVSPTQKPAFMRVSRLCHTTMFSALLLNRAFNCSTALASSRPCGGPRHSQSQPASSLRRLRPALRDIGRRKFVGALPFLERERAVRAWSPTDLQACGRPSQRCCRPARIAPRPRRPRPPPSGKPQCARHGRPAHCGALGRPFLRRRGFTK